jgi:hypothetical protein
MNEVITINGNTIAPAFFTLLRQLVLTLSGYLLGKGILDRDIAEAIAWILVFTITMAYGQARGWLERRKLITMAEAAPDHIAKVE